MRSICLGVIFLFLTACLTESAVFAQLELPRTSQKASVMQRIGLLDVTVNYSRPNVKGRVIWGELVPYKAVWRTGADEATNISFSEDVTLNGNKLSAGKYGFFTVPDKEEWTIVINKVVKQWGAFNYDSTKDVLRFKAKPRKNEFTESLEYSFENVSADSAELVIKWENIKVPFTIRYDIDAKAYSNIKKAIQNASPDDEVVYAASANYAADNNIHKDESMQWVDKSIEIKPTYYNYFVKAKLLANDGKIKEALSYLERSRQAGKNDPEFKNTYSVLVDKLERELKKRK